MASRRTRKKKRRTNQNTKAKATQKSQSQPEKQIIKRTHMEIAVYVVGAFATISGVVMGVMFSRHHNTAGIWLLFVTLLLLSLGLCLWLQDKVWKTESSPVLISPTNEAPLSAPIPASEGVPNAVAEPTTTSGILDIAPEYFMQFYRDHTDAQATRLMQVYIGKTIKVSGTVDDVADFSNRTLVLLDLPKTAKYLRLSISARVTDDIQRQRALALRRGDQITMVGEIEEAGASHVIVTKAHFSD